MLGLYIEHLIDELHGMSPVDQWRRHHFQAPALLLPRGRPAWMLKVQVESSRLVKYRGIEKTLEKITFFFVMRIFYAQIIHFI